MLVTLNLTRAVDRLVCCPWNLSCGAFQGCAVRALCWLQGTVHNIFCMQWSLALDNLLGRWMVSWHLSSPPWFYFCLGNSNVKQAFFLPINFFSRIFFFLSALILLSLPILKAKVGYPLFSFLLPHILKSTTASNLQSVQFECVGYSSF